MFDEVKRDIEVKSGETLLIGVTGEFFIDKNTLDANEVEQFFISKNHVNSFREQFAFKGVYEQYKLYEMGLIDSWSI